MENIIYYDIEYIEGNKKPNLFYPLCTKKSYIAEPIFICMLDNKGNTYEAIFNNFNLDAAWGDVKTRNYILHPLYKRYFKHNRKVIPFTKKTIKRLLKLEGKSRSQISQDIKDFVKKPYFEHDCQLVSLDSGMVQSMFAKIFEGESNIPYALNRFTYSLRQKYIDKVLRYSKDKGVSFEKADFIFRSREDFPKDFDLKLSYKNCLDCFKQLDSFLNTLNKEGGN